MSQIQEWNYAKSGQTCGPVSLEELRLMISQGQLNANDLVWRPGMTVWAKIGSVPELGGSAAPAASPIAYEAPSIEPLLFTDVALNHLANTRFWVRTVSVVMWVAAVFMMIVGIVGLVIGMATGKTETLVMIIYVVFAPLYIVPAWYLWRYGSRVREVKALRRADALEQAINEQRRFWKFVGICVFVIIGIYIVAIPIAIIAAILS